MPSEPLHNADYVVGCDCIMFRGLYSGRVVTCGVCPWCRDHFDAEGELIDGPGGDNG